MNAKEMTDARGGGTPKLPLTGMKTITIRNVPADLYQRLQHRAEKNGRRLSEEILHILGIALQCTRDGNAIKERARNVRASMNVCLTEKDLEEMKPTGRA